MISPFVCPRLCSAAWIMLAWLVARPAAAQRLPQLMGSRVRMQVDSGQRLSGVVIGQSADSLTLHAKAGVSDYSVALPQVRHLERYTPHRMNPLLVLGGVVVGGALGFVGGKYSMDRGTASCRATLGHNDMCGFDPVSTPVFTLGGALFGTVVGALVKVSSWETVF